MSLRSRGGHSSRELAAALAARSVRLRADLVLAVFDGLAAAVSYTTILAIRFDGQIPAHYGEAFHWFLPAAVAAHLVANWIGGLYGEMWRHAGIQEARRVVLAGAGTLAALAGVSLSGGRSIPISVLVLGAAFTVLLGGAMRFQSRLLAFRRRETPRSRRVIVVGAGEAGAALVRGMLEAGDGPLPVVAVDDDPRKQGRSLHGVPIVAGTGELAEVVGAVRAEEILLAVPSADAELVRTVAEAADDAGVPVRTVPSIGELVEGRATVTDVRDLRLSDLLGRKQITTDLEAVSTLLADRRVLITGGGGSIGAEIARQVAACRPAELLLLDHDETHLYDAAGALDDRCVELLADIRDREVIDRLIARLRPEVVFHAAAHKHVPLLERHPCEAIRTNVLGTANVVNAATRHGVERLVLISTDKAVRPSSVMGASKRVAEQIALSHSGPGRHYCGVRFGNVLGSRGSVVPRFTHQIERGGPVTVTDARMTRFFMSITEAVQLVLQSAVFAEGGEIFMLEMGEPIRIVDLAQRMIRLSGHRVGTDVAVRIIGPRPGEKLTEDLFLPDETPAPTPHPSIMVLHPALLDDECLHEGLGRLREAADADDQDAATNELHDLAATPGTVLRVPTGTAADATVSTVGSLRATD
ncbi:MAG: polysaccharide biosynthesis protein [Actinobacteria bacterium]|nr:polysaccharide biosynthesis protein [Actinomycetota bacterium]